MQLLVGGTPTNVFSLRSTRPEGSSDVPLVVVVPGNPGISQLYIPFARKFYNLGHKKFDVSVISNAGQSPGCYKKTSDSTKDPECESGDWYCLQDQVQHKLAYIEQEAAERKSLILIGHSIGCLIVLRMLQHLSSARVLKVVLLFPVIEHVARTPNAHSWTSYLWSFLQGPFLLLAWIVFRLTPSFLWTYFWKYCYFSKSPHDHVDILTEGMKQFNEKCMYNLLQYARYEMKRICEPPLDVISRNIHKIVFYYGRGDYWNIDSCYKNMAARYPGRVHMLPSHIKHAFVEHSSDDVAHIVSSSYMNC